MEVLAEHRCFGGVQGYYRHESAAIGLPMSFAIFSPPGDAAKRPALLFLAGLTCNHETFAIKAGAQRLAAELGIAIITPDTSPRGAGVPGEDQDWDLGSGAGFYLDACEPPWDRHYRMESYLLIDLLPLAAERFDIDLSRIGICGHSMGGHGALTLALRHSEQFVSVSALAPICAPSRCAWGQKAFTAYLGADQARWLPHDASALMQAAGGPRFDSILIDQGLADNFLEPQLNPAVFEQACREVEQGLQMRTHPGYDHGYYFIQSFIADHLRHHAQRLTG